LAGGFFENEEIMGAQERHTGRLIQTGHDRSHAQVRIQEFWGRLGVQHRRQPDERSDEIARQAQGESRTVFTNHRSSPFCGMNGANGSGSKLRNLTERCATWQSARQRARSPFCSHFRLDRSSIAYQHRKSVRRM
jgi:hypothetical protein